MKVNLILAFSICIWFAFGHEGNETTQDLTAVESFATETFTFSSFKLIDAFNKRFPQVQIAKPSSEKQLEFTNLAISDKMTSLNEETLVNTFSPEQPNQLRGLFEGSAKNSNEEKRAGFIKNICTKFNEAVGYSGIKTIRFRFEDAHKVAEMIEDAIKHICSFDPKYFNSKVEPELVAVFKNESAIKFPNTNVLSSTDTWWSLKNSLDWVKTSMLYIGNDTSLMNQLEKAIYKFEKFEKSQENLNNVKKMVLCSLKNGNKTGERENASNDSSLSTDEMNHLGNMLNKLNAANKNNLNKRRKCENFDEIKTKAGNALSQKTTQPKGRKKNSGYDETNPASHPKGVSIWILLIILFGVLIIIAVVGILIKKRYFNKGM